MNTHTFYQAIIFGIVVVLIGLILSMIFSFLKPELPKECEKWDEHYVMEIILFLTGFIIRYMLENRSIGKYMYSS